MATESLNLSINPFTAKFAMFYAKGAILFLAFLANSLRALRLNLSNPSILGELKI